MSLAFSFSLFPNSQEFSLATSIGFFLRNLRFTAKYDTKGRAQFGMKTVSEQRENVLSEFEGRFGFSIPASLREVILGVPCELGRSFVGSDTGLGCLQEINEWAREIVLSDARPDVLKKSDFVFIMHGGYIFYYVPCDEGSDPPVYIYYEGKKSSPQLEGDSFTAWFWGEETDRKSRKKWYQFNWLRKSSRT